MSAIEVRLAAIEGRLAVAEARVSILEGSPRLAAKMKPAAKREMRPPSDSSLLTSREACGELEITMKTLSAYCCKGAIPFTFEGGRRRFARKDIDAYISGKAYNMKNYHYKDGR